MMTTYSSTQYAVNTQLKLKDSIQHYATLRYTLCRAATIDVDIVELSYTVESIHHTLALHATNIINMALV